MALATTTQESLSNLVQARGLALKHSSYYAQIVPSVLPVIGTTAALEIRRWGADFLAETFASPSLAADSKQTLSLTVLPIIKAYLEKEDEDDAVVKSIIQAAASTYALIFRHLITNPNDSETWQSMSTVKSNILRRMDFASPGVHICCIKFVQRVVQVQTPGMISDPRRPEQNETSLALVPRDHPLIPPRNLEPEASGLLDRLLSVLQDHDGDALLVTATVNSLGVLVRNRASIANKIINAVLAFNPLKHANSPMTPKMRVNVKSMERTIRIFLLNIIRKNPNHPLMSRIQQHVERLHHMRLDIVEGDSRKRAAPAEPTDGLDSAKRQRLGAEPVGTPPLDIAKIPPLPPGPVTFAQLFTLTQEIGLRSFDVSTLPSDLVINLITPLLKNISQVNFDAALNVVRSRYLDLNKRAQEGTLNNTPVAPATSNVGAEEDDEDDYEPDYEPGDDSEQPSKANDSKTAQASDSTQNDIPLGPFKLSQPPPMSEEEAVDNGKLTVRRVFNAMTELDDRNTGKARKAGFNRLAASDHDRMAWVTLISRIATRAEASPEDISANAAEAEKHRITLRKKFNLGDSIRDALYLHVIEDFRKRIEVAIMWLNEEWYNDRLQEKEDTTGAVVMTRYEHWVLRVVDGIMPYLDARDKVLIRFMSEIPAISEEILDRVKKLARDPERVNLAVQSLHYLVLYRPPVREMCLNALEDLWRNYEDARKPSEKLLVKWRPGVLEATAVVGEGELANGVAPEVKLES